MTEQIEFYEHGRSMRLDDEGGNVYIVTSGRKAKLASLIAECASGEAVIHLWDANSGLPTSQSGCPILEIITEFGKFQAAEDELIGAEFSSSIWARVTDSTLSGTPFLRIGVKEY
jgi:hypothetical protein